MGNPKSGKAEEKKIIPSKAVTKFAEAIKKFEKYEPGTRSSRNNNPGNLRGSKNRKGSKFESGRDKDEFSKFKNYETGWMALKYDISCKFKGGDYTRHKELSPKSTLLEFFKIYDRPNYENYAKFVAKKMGVGTTTTIEKMFKKYNEDVNNLYINKKTGETGFLVEGKGGWYCVAYCLSTRGMVCGLVDIGGGASTDMSSALADISGKKFKTLEYSGVGTSRLKIIVPLDYLGNPSGVGIGPAIAMNQDDVRVFPKPVPPSGSIVACSTPTGGWKHTVGPGQYFSFSREHKEVKIAGLISYKEGNSLILELMVDGSISKGFKRLPGGYYIYVSLPGASQFKLKPTPPSAPLEPKPKPAKKRFSLGGAFKEALKGKFS